ncbi:hypothetical protein [Roseateles amylovorans]|uniref:Uncharacterized protein n=1 Tax=Roseateles amylovorans TaxID=2978473 RepID=A0ABY6B5L7_9BURK|nr:hypothetical protein [Roseateles amylovorans]UXH80470.1 hypothetical protein N4261_11600 [Roseateles amylovorans]
MNSIESAASRQLRFDMAEGSRLRDAILSDLERTPRSEYGVGLPLRAVRHRYVLNAGTLVGTTVDDDPKTMIDANRVDAQTLVMGIPCPDPMVMRAFLHAMRDEDVRLIVDLSTQKELDLPNTAHYHQGGHWSPGAYSGSAQVEVANGSSQESVQLFVGGSGAGASWSSHQGGRPRRPDARSLGRSTSQSLDEPVAAAVTLRCRLIQKIRRRQRSSQSWSCDARTPGLEGAAAPQRPRLTSAGSGASAQGASAPAVGIMRSLSEQPPANDVIHELTHLQIPSAAAMSRSPAGLMWVAGTVDAYVRRAGHATVAFQDADGGQRCALVLAALDLIRSGSTNLADREQLIIQRYANLCRQRGEHLLPDEPDLAVLAKLAAQPGNLRCNVAWGPDRDDEG